jgi:hypothetical protein
VCKQEKSLIEVIISIALYATAYNIRVRMQYSQYTPTHAVFRIRIYPRPTQSPETMQSPHARTPTRVEELSNTLRAHDQLLAFASQELGGSAILYAHARILYIHTHIRV